MLYEIEKLKINIFPVWGMAGPEVGRDVWKGSTEGVVWTHLER